MQAHTDYESDVQALNALNIVIDCLLSLDGDIARGVMFAADNANIRELRRAAYLARAISNTISAICDRVQLD